MWVIDNQQYLGKLEGWNRAAQFADGLFETMVVKNQKIQGLHSHVARMQHGLTRLNITSPEPDLTDLFVRYAQSLSEQSAHSNGVLKILISRGDSQRGYGYESNIKPHITAFYNQLPAYDAHIYTKGVALTCLQTQCAIQPQMAGLKHLNRLENVLAKAELGLNGFEGLMQNHLGFLIEGTMSNVFFESDEGLITSDLSLSGVAGVMREHVLRFCKREQIPVSIRNILMSEVAEFSKGFICNSVLGVVPIAKLEQHVFSMGTITKRLVETCESGDIYL